MPVVNDQEQPTHFPRLQSRRATSIEDINRNW